MVEKDIIETKISENKEKIDDVKDKVNEKVDETINEQREKRDERRERNRERFDETRERSKEFTDKMASDFSRSMDDIKESIKNMQKYADEKINEYKKTTFSSLDVDLVESDDKYYLKVSVPGINKEDVDIQAGDNDIIISTTFKPLIEELEDIENGRVIRSELKSGKCSKTVKFENSIEVEEISAKFDNGIVLITIPKLTIPKHKVNVE